MYLNWEINSLKIAFFYWFQWLFAFFNDLTVSNSTYVICQTHPKEACWMKSDWIASSVLDTSCSHNHVMMFLLKSWMVDRDGDRTQDLWIHFEEHDFFQLVEKRLPRVLLPAQQPIDTSSPLPYDNKTRLKILFWYITS